MNARIGAEAGTGQRGRPAARIQLMLAAMLAVGAVGHLGGTLFGYPPGTELFIWSLAGVLGCAMLSALNFIRLGRADDSALTWLCGGGCTGWAMLAVSFNLSIHHPLDPRGMIHFVASIGLAAFCALEVFSLPRR